LRFARGGPTIQGGRVRHESYTFSNNSWGHGRMRERAGDRVRGTDNGAPLFYGGIPPPATQMDQRGISAKKKKNQRRRDCAIPSLPTSGKADVFWRLHGGSGKCLHLLGPNLPAAYSGRAMVCENTMKIHRALLDGQAKAGRATRRRTTLQTWGEDRRRMDVARSSRSSATTERFCVRGTGRTSSFRHNPTPKGVAARRLRGENRRGGGHENQPAGFFHESGPHPRHYRVGWTGIQDNERSVNEEEGVVCLREMAWEACSQDGRGKCGRRA